MKKNFAEKLKRVINETDSKLTKTTAEYILDHTDKTDEEIQSWIEDLLTYGCQSGMVSNLIYYRDTLKFYKTHQEEINDLLKETMFNTGYNNPKELFGDNWDEEDPLALDTLNQNLLAWFGFEETTRNIALNELEMDI